LAILGRPVNARAAFSAAITASVPEFTKRMRSKPPLREQTCSACRTSCSVAIMNAVPRPSCAATASTTGGYAWPWISEATLFAKSMRVTPSMSVTRQPAPCAT